VPVIMVVRARRSTSLDQELATVPASPPAVSIIIPARNESRNIGPCLRSILASDYPLLSVIIVDDHSTDGTAAAALAAAAGDQRVTILLAPALPDGWFGKQWACAVGARAAQADILAFVDADTLHSPDLVTRAVRAMERRNARLLSIVGRQTLVTFWERVVQPHVFAAIAQRYGGTEEVSRSSRAVDKLANGQCLFITNDAYARAGGHESVRETVSDDVALAQRVHETGGGVALVLGAAQLSTRMYTGLADLMRGWGKNVFAGGRTTAPFGRVGRALFPLMLLVSPLMTVAPPAVLLLAALGLVGPVIAASALVAASATLLFWSYVYHRMGYSTLYSLLYPLGGAVLLVICVRAIARGSNVEWRGRLYTSR